MIIYYTALHIRGIVPSTILRIFILQKNHLGGHFNEKNQIEGTCYEDAQLFGYVLCGDGRKFYLSFFLPPRKRTLLRPQIA
jgi:hypothetical protein